MQDNNWEQNFMIHCLIKTLALVLAIVSTVFLLFDLMSCQLTAFRYVLWILGLFISMFVYFYISDSFWISDDEEE